MKVKHYHREYDSYKTERQWALEGFLVAENVEGIELLPSKQSKQPCKYYKPDEVRPATESELQAFFQPEKERRREQARAYRKARLEREQDGDETLYVTVKYQNGLAYSNEKYVEEDEFN